MEQEWFDLASNRKIKKFHFEIMDFWHLTVYGVTRLLLEMNGDTVDMFWELVSCSACPQTHLRHLWSMQLFLSKVVVFYRGMNTHIHD